VVDGAGLTCVNTFGKHTYGDHSVYCFTNVEAAEKFKMNALYEKSDTLYQTKAADIARKITTQQRPA
jgi:hypothetical protein